MTQQEIIEGNKLIAGFMDVHYAERRSIGIALCDKDGSPWDYDSIVWLSYNSDWSLLMPVVKKIQQLKIEDWNKKKPIMNALHDVDIEILYQSVVVFLHWYNQNKKI